MVSLVVPHSKIAIKDFFTELIYLSHLGKFAVVTVGKIANLDELAQKAFLKNIHFAESIQGEINPSELVAILINQKGSIKEGISNAQAKVNNHP